MCLSGFSKPDKKDANTDNASGVVQISSELIRTTWKLTPVVLGEKKSFFSALCEIYHIQSQFSQPVIPDV